MLLKSTGLGAAVLTLAAGGAAAQDSLCGGFGAAGVWAGGGAETSDVATVEHPFDVNGRAASGRDIVTLFSLSAPSEVRIEARPAEGDDTVITLYDETGFRILTDDDGGGGLASLAETPLDPGAYCVVTSSYDNAPLSAEIRIGLTSHDRLLTGSDPDVSCGPEAEAAALADGPVAALTGAGLSASAPISSISRYRFTLSDSVPLSVRAENEAADPYLYLFSEAGVRLAENDDAEGLNARLDYPDGLAAGSYCIVLRALSDPAAPVQVSLVPFDEAAVVASFYARGQASPPLDGSYPVADLGVIDDLTRRDVVLGDEAVWFSFEMPERGLLVIDAIGAGGADPATAVFDDLGRLVARNDDGGEGTTDSMIATRAERGAYTLAVTRVGSGSPAPVRVAIERFVRAADIGE